MTLLIDSHVNLHHHAFDPDRDAVIARARNAGVARMITICDRIENFPAVIAIAEAHDDIYASVGAHPHYAKDHQELTAERLIELGRHEKVVGVGETGLDQHYKFSPVDDQVRVFRAHATAAHALGKPLIIHTREADEAMAELLEEEAGKGPLPILMHCYTSGPELARRVLKLGAYFSFSGIMTFKNADDVRAIAGEVPLDRVIVETDCPYLAPVPHRGQRCEPMHVADVQRAFAQLRGLGEAEASALLADNFHRLFPLIPRAAGESVMGTLRVTVLGCGSSGGVPRATGDWGVCDPNEPKNRRTRCGLLLQKWSGAAGRAEEATTVLIDTPPELRQQLADAGAKRLDAVVISHDHADQTNGFDDVRAFFLKQRATIPVWMDQATRATFAPRLGYAFESHAGYPAIARFAGDVSPLVPIPIDGPGGVLELMPLDQDHGFSRSLGFRAGPAGYSNDLVAMPDASFAQLEGLSLWIVDALRDRPHPTHAHVERTLEWIARLKPELALLTNMHIDLDYASLKARLPAGVEPAYDGWAGEYPI